MSVLEKVLLASVGGIISPCISAIMLFWSRRRLKEGQRSESRAFLFYSALSGVLLGQYICHTAIVDDHFDTRIMNLCALAGFFILYVIESELRLWNAAPQYIAPIDGDIEIDSDSGLQRAKMEQDSIVVARGVNTEQMSRVVFGTLDVAKDENKRVVLLALMYVNMAVILCMDGFLLVYRPPSIGVTVCFIINTTSLSIAMYSAMIHAKYHVYEEFKQRTMRWVFLTVVWSSLVLLCTLPLMIDMSRESAAMFVESYATLCFYGLASGFILKLCFYYFNRGVERSNRRMIRWGELVFALAAAQSAATGVWL